MLQLKNIVKQYRTGDETVDALRGVNIDFRESEFVSVLGPSGCGKTTLLNIIGGLDKYTSGDLIISDAKTAGGYSYVDYDENDNEITKTVTVGADTEVKQYKQYALALADLKAGRIDAILMDKLPAQTMLASSGN